MGRTLTKTILLFLSLIISQSACTQHSNEEPSELPAHFIGNRIFVRPVTLQGDTLDLYIDTGGGLFLTSDAVNRLNLPTKKVVVDDDTVTRTSLPKFIADASIPSIPSLPNTPVPHAMQGHLAVFSSEKSPDFYGDGMLGQVWFAKRMWTFDYLNQKLLLRKSGELPTRNGAHQVPIHFRTDSVGQHTGHWPRIQAVVNADTLNFLLDTGATLVLSDSARVALNDEKPQIRGTSYIIASVFDQWREQHSRWRVIENAELPTAQPIIKVPQVTITGYTVGPVWFTRRPDKNFTEYMSQFMDRQIVGALGGSLFQYFRMTINYPDELAYFEVEE